MSVSPWWIRARPFRAIAVLGFGLGVWETWVPVLGAIVGLEIREQVRRMRKSWEMPKRRVSGLRSGH